MFYPSENSVLEISGLHNCGGASPGISANETGITFIFHFTPLRCP